MNVWEETNWFALQAKPFREELAAAAVAALDTEVFLPRVRQEQLVCGARRAVIMPLFSGYFFAKFCPLVLLDSVRYARGVLRVVGSSRFPIPLEDEIVRSIRERVQPDGFIQLQQPRLQPGTTVTIEHGPLAGWMGKVERELDDGRRVAILLDALQQTRVLIEKRWVTPAPVAA